MTLKDLVLVMSDDKENWHWGYPTRDKRGYPHVDLYNFKKSQLFNANADELAMIEISCITSKGFICVKQSNEMQMRNVMNFCNIPIAISS